MKTLKTLSCAAVLALSFAGAAQAAGVIHNWVFNPIGAGSRTGQTVNEYLDVNGNAFIQLASTGGSGFSFNEHAVFNVNQADSNGQLFQVNYPGGNITATFQGTGSGTLGGNFSFSSGVINIYQDTVNNYGTSAGVYGANDGKLIASFNVLPGGGGSVDASGNPISNGQVTVMAQAAKGAITPGYFFLPDGTDLSTVSIMSFAFTNANNLANPPAILVSEVACQYSGFTGPGCNGTAYANAPGQYFFVSNNGQFKLAAVPEPGSLALFGIALLGASVVSRKRGTKA